MTQQKEETMDLVKICMDYFVPVKLPDGSINVSYYSGVEVLEKYIQDKLSSQREEIRKKIERMKKEHKKELESIISNLYAEGFEEGCINALDAVLNQLGEK